MTGVGPGTEPQDLTVFLPLQTVNGCEMLENINL